jgi:hypothetical protein
VYQVGRGRREREPPWKSFINFTVPFSLTLVLFYVEVIKSSNLKKASPQKNTSHTLHQETPPNYKDVVFSRCFITQKDVLSFVNILNMFKMFDLEHVQKVFRYLNSH